MMVEWPVEVVALRRHGSSGAGGRAVVDRLHLPLVVILLLTVVAHVAVSVATTVVSVVSSEDAAAGSSGDIDVILGVVSEKAALLKIHASELGTQVQRPSLSAALRRQLYARAECALRGVTLV